MGAEDDDGQRGETGGQEVSLRDREEYMPEGGWEKVGDGDKVGMWVTKRRMGVTKRGTGNREKEQRQKV